MRLFTLTFVTLLLPITSLYSQKIPNFPQGKQGLEQMLDYILSAKPSEVQALSDSLKPDPQDYSLVFDTYLAEDILKYHKKVFRHNKSANSLIAEDQTRFKLSRATRAELIHYTGEARDFPGGYREIARYLKPDLVYYHFTLHEPGHRIGSPYGLFVHLEGKWRFFPQPWIALFEGL